MTSSMLISTRVEKYRFTRRYASITRLTTSRDAQMSSTSERGPISWSFHPRTTAPTLINMAGSSTSLRYPSTTEAKRNLGEDRGDRKSRSFGSGGLNRPLNTRMGSHPFDSRVCNLSNKTERQNGIASFCRLKSCVLLTRSPRLHMT
jgi:hypothetical protein